MSRSGGESPIRCSDGTILGKLLTAPWQIIAHDALSALINLSDDLAVAWHLVDHEFLVWLVSYTAVSQQQ